MDGECNPLIEWMAREGHRDWLAGKRENGVTTWKSELGDELMLDWEDLTERARESNRRAVARFFHNLNRFAMREGRG